MTFAPQVRIPATYMRGGTSKGVFFRLQDLPERCQAPGEARDRLFLRVIGSPDPYAAHIDGMGGATSSTSKCVILSKSARPDHDVDYLYGQVSIDKAFVDWSGNCGNLSTAAGAFAIHAGLVDPSRIPRDGTCVVRIWQANIAKTIVAHVPVTNGQVQETGDFELDGVTFPAAEIVLEFIDPAAEADASGGAMFPTGHLVDDLEVPGVGTFEATMITAGIPTVFVNAEDIGYTGTELREQINSTGVFRVLELDDLLPEEVKGDNIRLDPTKITVDISSCGMTVDELQQELFSRFNITIEKSTFNTITLLLTIGTTRSKCSRLYDALMRIAREKRAPRRLYRTPDLPPFTELVSLPRDAYYATGELVPLLDENDQLNGKLAGRICCDQIVPYPPGIPVLVPGQRITANIVDYLVRYLRVQNKVELHGVVYQGYVPSIRVLMQSEERHLAHIPSQKPARRRAA